LLENDGSVLATPSSYNTPMGIVITIRNQLTPFDKYFIAEMGAYKKGEINELVNLVQPSIGIVTSVGEQHLLTFKNINNVLQTKMELAEGLPVDGCAILNYDDLLIRNYQFTKFTGKKI